MKDVDVDEESLDVRTRNDTSLELRVFRPDLASPSAAQDDGVGLPLILLFHGGHYVLGSPANLGLTCTTLAKAHNAVVVASQYSLAPEHTFPVSIEDAWDVLSWCAANAKSKLYADPSQAFIIGGVSSGGSMSVVLAHMARDQNLQPPLTGLYLAAASIRAPNDDPTTLPQKYRDRFLSRTQKECVESAVLPSRMSSLMESLHRPDKTSELYAPLIWPTGHANLPPTYFQICGIDTCRDEDFIFADMLRSEGVPTRIDVYEGLPHAFWGVLKKLPRSKAWRQDTVDGFDWLFAQQQLAEGKGRDGRPKGPFRLESVI